MAHTLCRTGPLAASLMLLWLPHITPAVQQPDDSAMNRRGDHVMGFDHDKTTHHFTLTKSGGIIQVTANDSSDTASRDHIRMHLEHIFKAFATGDFVDPMEVHNEVPPGVPVMKDREDKIRYRFESIPDGAKVVITTKDPKALDAIHDYLRYQIREHHTADPLSVP